MSSKMSSGSSVPDRPHRLNGEPMNSGSSEEMRDEYELRPGGGVRGKYYQKAAAGTNLVLIEPDLADVFPDTESVNRALRLLADTAEAVAGPTRRERRAPNTRLKRAAGKPAA